MSTNVGTLVGAAIRPIDSNDLISTAYDNEIKGGHHSYSTIIERNSIIVQRRTWGMLCTVYNNTADITKNNTYQLKFGYSSLDIMDNNNWVVFSSGQNSSNGGISDKYWLNPVISILTVEPTTPLDGDSYIMGIDSNNNPTGANWGSLIGGLIGKWNSTLNKWDYTTPINGFSLRVNDQFDSIYRYYGDYSTGKWVKERVNQVFSLDVTSLDGIEYTSTVSQNLFTYSTDHIYLARFSATNSGTNSVSLNLNGMGSKLIRKQTLGGDDPLMVRDLVPNRVYTLVYDGDIFKFNKSISDSSFDIKWRIRGQETIQVPSWTEYVVYGDLEVEGVLDIDDNAKVVIINGQLIMNGGIVNNNGSIETVYFRTLDLNDPNSSPFKKTATMSLVSGVTYSIQHDFNTPAVIVNTWDEITGEQILMNVKRISNDAITIQSLTDLSNVRVVVMA
jgi:hypothetical protein